MDTYTVSTPYGTVTISDSGRRVTFELYSDIRQSRHNQALFTYVNQLLQRGVTAFNVDHIPIEGRDRSLNLTRGKAKLDLVYRKDGKLYECELKTSREVGLDLTARQLIEMAKYCENLIALVPRGCMEDMKTILRMINLDHKVSVSPYDELTEED